MKYKCSYCGKKHISGSHPHNNDINFAKYDLEKTDYIFGFGLKYRIKRFFGGYNEMSSM